ncbi:hypothetical protein LBMAG26_13760 [Bacteroidota bacterium]|nr:hypothetical protein LBMAG26_13760 [Bacteroidota bacterium]
MCGVYTNNENANRHEEENCWFETFIERKRRQINLEAGINKKTSIRNNYKE